MDDRLIDGTKHAELENARNAMGMGPVPIDPHQPFGVGVNGLPECRPDSTELPESHDGVRLTYPARSIRSCHRDKTASR